MRARSLSQARFLVLALAACASLYVIVVTGALVRLTASGLGCESWPGCEEGAFFPAEDYHAFIEFGNRVFGAVPLGLTLLTWLAARGIDGLPRWVERLALVTFAGTLVQAPLGLLVIVTDLEPALVIAHFLIALVILGGALVIALEARGLEEGHAPALPAELRRAGLVLAAACLVLVVTGTFVTAAGPHSGGTDIARLGDLENALWVHVRVAAVFGLMLLFVLGYLAACRTQAPGLFRLGLAVVVLALAQSAVGELQWRAELPWGVVLVHVALAGALWGATVTLAALLFRPLRSLTTTST